MNQDSFHHTLQGFVEGKISRRDFLRSSLALATVSSLGHLLGCVYQTLDEPPRLSVEDDRKMSVVFDVLLPSEQGSPGASDLDTLAYLHFVLLDPTYDSDDKELIYDGLKRLEGVSTKRYEKTFLSLTDEERHTLFEHLATLSWGKRWISRLLNVALEGMLADPIYGSNRGGIGWRWLEIQPGIPRPTSIPLEMRRKV